MLYERLKKSDRRVTVIQTDRCGKSNEELSDISVVLLSGGPKSVSRPLVSRRDVKVQAEI